MTIKNENTIFIISSFHKKYKNVIELAIKPAIEEAGYKSTIADGSGGGSEEIYADMSQKLYNSSMCIADVSKKYDDKGDLINLENVYYEISAAHTLGKHVILLCTDPESLPYNIKNQRTVQYDSDDLDKLKKDIVTKIKMLNAEVPYHRFPQIKFLSEEIEKELDRLRQESTQMTVSVYPPSADIFLNDVLLGQSPQTLYVNKTARNTVSIAAPAYFEEHFVISKEEYDNGKIDITLQKTDRNQSTVLNNERVYGWLANRRKDPNNPVLMRAIAQFLSRSARMLDKADSEKAKQYRDDAKNELEELLKVAPGWYMAHNQVGVFYKKDFETSLYHYKVATALNPDNYLGYFNQACAYARNEDYDKVFEILQVFLEDEKILESYSYSNMKLSEDDAFEKIKKDPDLKRRFESLVSEIDRKALHYRVPHE